MNLSALLGFLALGALAGLVAAFLGVGGGIIMVPALVHIAGLSQKHAVATALAIIVPTALAATAQNIKAGLIDWKILVPTAIGAVLVAYFGAEWMRALSNQTLSRIFAVVLIAVGIQMLLAPGKADPKPGTPADSELNPESAEGPDSPESD